MRPEKDLFAGVKPPTIEERARRDFAEFYAHRCRVTKEGTFLWFFAWRTQGPAVARWNGRDWESVPISVRNLRATKPADLPPGASCPEEPKK